MLAMWERTRALPNNKKCFLSGLASSYTSETRTQHIIEPSIKNYLIAHFFWDWLSHLSLTEFLCLQKYLVFYLHFYFILILNLKNFFSNPVSAPLSSSLHPYQLNSSSLTSKSTSLLTLNYNFFLPFRTLPELKKSELLFKLQVTICMNLMHLHKAFVVVVVVWHIRGGAGRERTLLSHVRLPPSPLPPPFSPWFLPSFLLSPEHSSWPHHGVGTELNTANVKINQSRHLPARNDRNMRITTNANGEKVTFSFFGLSVGMIRAWT